MSHSYSHIDCHSHPEGLVMDVTYDGDDCPTAFVHCLAAYALEETTDHTEFFNYLIRYTDELKAGNLNFKIIDRLGVDEE